MNTWMHAEKLSMLHVPRSLTSRDFYAVCNLLGDEICSPSQGEYFSLV